MPAATLSDCQESHQPTGAPWRTGLFVLPLGGQQNGQPSQGHHNSWLQPNMTDLPLGRLLHLLFNTRNKYLHNPMLEGTVRDNSCCFPAKHYHCHCIPKGGRNILCGAKDPGAGSPVEYIFSPIKKGAQGLTFQEATGRGRGKRGRKRKRRRTVNIDLAPVAIPGPILRAHIHSIHTSH